MATRQHPLRPMIRRPVQHEHVHSAVRDDAALGPTEDLDRQPDGVSHVVVGLTALFSVMLAMLIAFMIFAGGTVSRGAAVLLALLAIPVIVSTLLRKSSRERDHVHPSR